MAVDAADHFPAVGLEARRGVVGEPAGGVAVDRDAVVVPERHQLAQAPGAGQRCGFMRNAFHQAAVAQEHPGAVVDDVVAGTVEALRQQLLGQGEADRVGQPLPERAGGGFHAVGDEVLRVPRGAVAELAEVLQLLDRQVVAGQVQQRVQQHRAVAVGKHETVAVEPLRVGRTVLEVVVPQHLGDVGHAHGHAGVAGLRGLDRVNGEETDGVGEFAAGRLGHWIRTVVGGTPGSGGAYCPTIRPAVRPGRSPAPPAWPRPDRCRRGRSGSRRARSPPRRPCRRRC